MRKTKNQEPEQTFKVGDRVKFTSSPAAGDTSVETSGIGVITRITNPMTGPHITTYWVEVDGQEYDVEVPYYRNDSIELAPYSLESNLKSEAQQRKDKPLARGCVDYFPDVLLAVAELSRIASKQHGHEHLHWEFGQSNDHADCLLRHFVDRGTLDTDGARHTIKVVWRAMALAQTELEAADPELHARRQEQRGKAARGE